MIQIPRASVMSIARARARYASLFSNFFVGALVRAPALTLVVLIGVVGLAARAISQTPAAISLDTSFKAYRARGTIRGKRAAAVLVAARQSSKTPLDSRDAETALGGVFERERVERVPDDGKSVDAAVAAVAAESTAAAPVRGISADASSVERARRHALGFATEIRRRRWTRAR